MPQGGILFDSAGDMFATTSAGGANGDGTVVEIALGSGSITTLHSFNGSDGTSPNTTPVFDSSGNIWAVTNNGGSTGNGTAFELSLPVSVTSSNSSGIYGQPVTFTATVGPDAAPAPPAPCNFRSME